MVDDRGMCKPIRTKSRSVVRQYSVTPTRAARRGALQAAGAAGQEALSQNRETLYIPFAELRPGRFWVGHRANVLRCGTAQLGIRLFADRTNRGLERRRTEKAPYEISNR